MGRMRGEGTPLRISPDVIFWKEAMKEGQENGRCDDHLDLQFAVASHPHAGLPPVISQRPLLVPPRAPA